MTRLARLFIVVAWMGSLAGVAAWAAGGQVPPTVAAPTPPAPFVYAGEDLGFRIDSVVNGVRRGTLVVRVDGKWVEVQFQTKVTPVR